MTPDELKIKLRDMPVNLSNSVSIYDALIAVIDLHKPRNITDRNIQGDVVTQEYCQVCEYLQGMNYPCSTIEAIEKELNG